MPDAAPPKVLIVEDDDDIRLALRHMLEDLEDFAIVEVADGQAALDAMVDTEFELMLLDVNLPLVSGDVVLTLIGFDEGFKRPGHIVIMSAAADLNQLRSRQVSVIVDSYLAKPFCYEDLQAIVAVVTDRGGPDDLLE